jgi:hypothetical protein
MGTQNMYDWIISMLQVDGSSSSLRDFIPILEWQKRLEQEDDALNALDIELGILERRLTEGRAQLAERRARLASEKSLLVSAVEQQAKTRIITNALAQRERDNTLTPKKEQKHHAN